MTKEQLSEIIMEKSKSLSEKVVADKYFENKLKEHANDNGKISNTDLALFAFSESIVFSRQLLYSVLCEVLATDN
ncbi:hypothetical protein I5677_12320 [Mobilitalea sibirica]|uniref:Uncharacterized protein n=1 Tax=Mobilitalea sibirica TaxID=1462919 RepID=A0A8J7H051_9FIRM|nr:hypothetical protein [Mobilitalea sibirica]MBH1941679.1 hypothetical protein [Mobilitalea sibirica]